MLLMRWFAALAGLAAVLGRWWHCRFRSPCTGRPPWRAIACPVPAGTGIRRWRATGCSQPATAPAGRRAVRADRLRRGCDRLVADRRWLAVGVAGCGSALALTVLLVPILVAVRVDRRHARRSVSATGPNTGPVDPFTSRSVVMIALKSSRRGCRRMRTPRRSRRRECPAGPTIPSAPPPPSPGRVPCSSGRWRSPV